jgi:FeS assembly protein IscX
MISPEWSDLSGAETTLTWDDSFLLVQALRRAHPRAELPSLGLRTLCSWILELPGFKDDPRLVNDDLLLGIYREWLEEIEAI